jgi:hypothetical protein
VSLFSKLSIFLVSNILGVKMIPKIVSRLTFNNVNPLTCKKDHSNILHTAHLRGYF